MRFLLKAEIPVVEGNTLARKGDLGSTLESIVKDMNPESAYFYTDHGKRTALVFFDMDDPSQIPAVAEPWFLAFDAAVEVKPVMVSKDLVKAGTAIKQAVEKYG